MRQGASGDLNMKQNTLKLFHDEWKKLLFKWGCILWNMGFGVAKVLLEAWMYLFRALLCGMRLRGIGEEVMELFWWIKDHFSSDPVYLVFVEPIYRELVRYFPRAEVSTDGVTIMGRLLDEWANLLGKEDLDHLRHQILQVHDEVSLYINFLKVSEQTLLEYEKLKNLKRRFICLVHAADRSISFLVLGKAPHNSLKKLVESMMFVRVEVMRIYKFCDVTYLHPPNESRTCIVGEDMIVGYEDEAHALMEKLTGVSKQLDVISVVGMAGIGKTTLARKVYNHPLIEQHFDVRGWTTVSHTFRVRDVILGILRSAFDFKDDSFQMEDDDKLMEMLYKQLKGQKYLIVMDDVWDVEAWYALKRVFSDDGEGSRILLTTRHKDVALEVNLRSHPHDLRSLTQKESWQLLKQKVFREEHCPIEFEEIGLRIVDKCRGLPLAIIVVAGVLAKREKTTNWWRQVVTSIGPSNEDDPYKDCMDTVALSYKHMPNHLRECFLYLGTFPEDYEIPVRELTWLWVAEGLAEQTSEKSPEDVAEDYLMKLIHRNLVLAGQRTYDGRIKTCRVHDLLHDFCLRKAQEENFLFRVESPYSIISEACKGVRVSMHSHFFDDVALLHPSSNIQSFSCLNTEWLVSPRNDISSIFHCFKHLNVLNILSIQTPFFPSVVMQLVLLKFIALRAMNGCPPASISNLQNLETLILLSRSDVTLPRNIWKIRKLRHLCIKTGENRVEDPLFEEVANAEDISQVLENLVTISQVCLSKSCLQVLQRTPFVKKLALCGNSLLETGFPCLDFLHCLGSLKLINTGTQPNFSLNLQMVKLPQNLKKLTLSHTQLKWDIISTIGMLESLEYLNLEFEACVGRVWKPCDGGFPQLKVLKLSFLNVKVWEATDSHFPALERLVVYGCKQLKGIPCDFANICTLQSIEVTWSSYGAEASAIQIRENQLELGNDDLKVVICPSFEERKKRTLQDEGVMLIRKANEKAENEYWEDFLRHQKAYKSESGSHNLSYFDDEERDDEE